MHYVVGRLVEHMRCGAIDDTMKMFTKMTSVKFEQLKPLIESRVKKMNTRFQEGISVTKKKKTNDNLKKLRFAAQANL